MGLIRPATLGLAIILSAPALWHGLVVGDMDLPTALERFLIAVAVSMAMAALLRGLTAGYRTPRRRATDRPGARDPAVKPGETP